MQHLPLEAIADLQVSAFGALSQSALVIMLELVPTVQSWMVMLIRMTQGLALTELSLSRIMFGLVVTWW